MLHVTNGELAAAMLRRAGMQGGLLPWRDVLHEGPVRAGLPRDAASEDEVVLWFEHDLYDQLQLVQVLDALGERPPRRLSLVCEAEYLGVMAPSRAAALFALRSEVSSGQLDAARRAWAAFRSPDPRAIPGEVTGLRFLGAALRRLLEEYPWTSDGLSRLERAILAALQEGALAFEDIFRAVREAPAFLGDTVLRWHLERLRDEAAIRFADGAWASTGAPPRRRRERWLGGVRALPDGKWRFDPASGRVVVE